MNSFVDAVKTVPTETVTNNGMKTYTSSMNALVDLFFAIGASRGKDISPAFVKAMKEDETIALRMLMWARDPRGGAGEREVVRIILKFLEKNYPASLDRVLPHLPEFGRFDDLLIFETREFKEKAWSIIGNALREAQHAKFMLSKLESMTEAEVEQILDNYN